MVRSPKGLVSLTIFARSGSQNIQSTKPALTVSGWGNVDTTEAVPHTVVDAVTRAYAARDVDKVAAYLHPGVEWTVSGPMDVLPFCGVFRGKAVALEVSRVISSLMGRGMMVAQNRDGAQP